MVEQARIHLSIAGLGIVFYSPFAVAHIRRGEDYIQKAFLEPEDIARSVNACTLTGFGTGGPGDFDIVIRDDADEEAIARAQFKVRLGVEVRDECLCFRDLYDLIRWDPKCPGEQMVKLTDGFYEIVGYTTYAAVGKVQVITLVFTRVPSKPILHYEGVPELCG